MARKGEVKRQRRQLKKKKEREAKREAAPVPSGVSPRIPQWAMPVPSGVSRRVPREAGQWPLLECLVTREWQNTMMLTQIVVARQAPDGRVAAGVFLVDLACLGIKNGYAVLFSSRKEYERQLRAQITAQQPMVRADLNLVAKIVGEATRYAADLGFKPHPDAADAMPLLADADPDACDVPIPLGGPEGKPFYISGPYDDAKAIIDHLVRRLGPDGFHYLVMLGGDEDLLEDWGMWVPDLPQP